MTMTSPISGNPIPPKAGHSATPAAREMRERELLARLFGQSNPAAQSTRPAPGRVGDDDTAPHLGRHLDVMA